MFMNFYIKIIRRIRWIWFLTASQTCNYDCTKTEVFRKGFLQGFFPHETADLVTFAEEILNGKLQFLCSVNARVKMWHHNQNESSTRYKIA